MTKCRISKEDLSVVLDLGNIYLNNFLKKKDVKAPKGKLRIGFGKKSKLVQLLDTANQDKLYKNDRQIKRKYIEHGLDKNNPRSIIVCGLIENSEDVIAKLKELCELEDQKSQS